MSNRKITAHERLLRSYRNAGRNEPVVHADGAGRVQRGPGRNNFPYGPVTKSPRLESLHKHAARPRRSYETTPDYASMNRDELRVAAKERGVEGWHKMNKAQLLAGLGATA